MQKFWNQQESHMTLKQSVEEEEMMQLVPDFQESLPEQPERSIGSYRTRLEQSLTDSDERANLGLTLPRQEKPFLLQQQSRTSS